MSVDFKIVIETREGINNLNNVNNAVDKTTAKFGDLRKTLNSITDLMKSTAVGLGIGLGIKELGQSIIQLRGQFQQVEVSMTTMLNSATKAQELIEQMKRTAIETPFSYMDVAESAKQLLAYGVAADEVNGTLKDLGDIAAGMGRNLNELIFLYGTTIRQQHMYTVDLRQFLGRGIPIGEYIAAQLGIAEDKLQEFVRAGKVTSEVFDTAIRNMANSKFANLMEKQSETITGRIEKIKDTIEIALADIGKANEGLINGTLDAISVAVANYREIGSAVIAAATAYGTYKAAVIACMAIEKASTAIRIAYIGAARLYVAAHLYCTRTTVALTAAQNALNKVLLKNPYVLVGTAIAALAAGMIYLAAKEDESTKIVREHEAAMREQQTAIENQKEAVNNLIGVITNETAAEGARYAAYERLHAIYGTIFKDYQTQAYYITHLAELQDQISKHDAEERVKNLQKLISEENTKIAKIKGDMEAILSPNMQGFELTNYNKLGSQLTAANKILSSLNGQLKTARVNLEATQVGNKSTAKLRQMAKELATGQSHIESKEIMDNTIDLLGDKYDKKTHLVRLSNGAVLNKDQIGTLLNAVREELGERKGKSETLNKSRNDLLSEIKTQKNKMQYAEAHGDEAGTLSMYKEASANYEKLKKEYKSLFGTTEKQQTSAAKKKYNEMISAEQKYINAKRDLLKLQEELAQKQLELENETEQARIDQMDDGTKKSIRQAELNAKKEQAALDKEWDEYRKSIAEVRFKTEQTEAVKNNKDGKKTVKKNFEDEWFDEKEKEKKGEKSKYSDITIDSIDNKQFKEYYKEKGKAIEKTRKDAYKLELESMRDYLKEYGTIQQQRVALIEEWNEKIEKAQSEGERLTAVQGKEQAVQEFDNEQLKKNIDWEQLFGDVGNMSVERLQSAKVDLKGMLSNKGLSIEDYQAIVEQIDKINDAIIDAQTNESIFSGFITEHAKERKKIEMEVAEAMEQQVQANRELNEANLSQNAAEQGLKQQLQSIGMGDLANKNITAADSQNIVSAVSQKYGAESIQVKAIQNALDNLVKSTTKVKNAQDKLATSTTNLKNKQDKKDNQDKDENFYTKHKETFDKIQRYAQDTEQLGGMIGGTAGNKISSAASAVNSGVGAVADFYSGNYVGAAVKAFSAVKSIGDVFGIGSGNAAEVADVTEKLTDSNEALRKSVDNLKDEIANSGGWKAISSATEAIENQQRINSQTMDILKAQMSYTAAHHSNAYNWALSNSDYAELNQSLSAYRKKNPTANTSQNSVYSLEDIYKLTPEQMDYIRTYNVDLWQKMLDQGDYDKSEYWEAYADLANELEDIKDSFKESMTQTTFDSLRDSFVNTLLDMDSDASDFADDFSEYMMQAMLNAKISDLLDDEIQEFYDKWSDYMESGNTLTSSEQEALREMYQKIAEKGLEIRDQVAEITGYTGDSSSSQSSTYGTASSFTQEQGDELNGRLTASVWYSAQINTNVQSLVTLQTANNTFLNEVRNLTLVSNGYLADIQKDTRKMYNEWTTKFDKMQKSLEKL